MPALIKLSELTIHRRVLIRFPFLGMTSVAYRETFSPVIYIGRGNAFDRLYGHTEWLASLLVAVPQLAVEVRIVDAARKNKPTLAGSLVLPGLPSEGEQRRLRRTRRQAGGPAVRRPPALGPPLASAPHARHTAHAFSRRQRHPCTGGALRERRGSRRRASP